MTDHERAVQEASDALTCAIRDAHQAGRPVYLRMVGRPSNISYPLIQATTQTAVGDLWESDGTNLLSV